ncbi:reticulon-1 [Mytilus galloprovincialis]|uniref:Reticulon-1 n=1 Tax=Mytilus galloprovincialis TaxID=29158 RepID=A0A8B6EBK2_MYTGA|nr:reticulon-1 [Mytilus galloprovincialis]
MEKLYSDCNLFQFGSIFTLPKVYETYKVQIDNYVSMACDQVCKVKAQVVAKLPFLKKKEKAQ